MLDQPLLQARYDKGQPITVPVTFGAAVTMGDVLIVNSQVTIAHASANLGDKGSVSLGHAFYNVKKATNVAYAQFAAIYWDDSAKQATATPSGNTYMGYAAVAAGTTDTTVNVWVPANTPPSVTSGGLATTIADPGASGAIPVTSSGHVDIVTAGAETRTIAAPTFAGQGLLLSAKTIVGTATVTVSNIFDGTNNTVALTAAGQSIEFRATVSGASLVWALVFNRGTTLSHV